MKFKRFLSFVLVFAMLMSLGVTAFAEKFVPKTEISGYEIRNVAINRIARATNDTPSVVAQRIENDIDTMDRCSIPLSDSIDVKYTNGRIEYLLEDYECVSNISVEEDTLGNVSFNIVEDDCSNVLEYRVDGTIMLNGSEVIIESSDSQERLLTNGARARYDDYSTTDFCHGASYAPYGSPKERSISTGTVLLRNIAKRTLASLICAAIGGIPGSCAKMLFLSVTGDIKSTAEVYAPNSNVCSFKIQEHVKVPQNSTLSLYYKYTGTYYANENFTNYAGSSTYYRYNYYA